MNKDLEATLAELGPGARAVVARLRAAREVAPARRFRPPLAFRLRPRAWLRAGSLAAASLVAAALFAVFCQSTPQAGKGDTNVYTIAYQPTAEARATLIASQRANGSWENDFLTRQNAAALREMGTNAARVAYLRAVRYLRAKNLTPLTPDEWRDARLLAAAWHRN